MAVAGCAVQALRFLLGLQLQSDKEDFLEDEELQEPTAQFKGCYETIAWQYLLGYLKDEEVDQLLELAFILLLPEAHLALIENKPDGEESYDIVQKYTARSYTKLRKVAEKQGFVFVKGDD